MRDLARPQDFNARYDFGGLERLFAVRLALATKLGLKLIAAILDYAIAAMGCAVPPRNELTSNTTLRLSVAAALAPADKSINLRTAARRSAGLGDV